MCGLSRAGRGDLGSAFVARVMAGVHGSHSPQEVREVLVVGLVRQPELDCGSVK